MSARVVVTSMIGGMFCLASVDVVQTKIQVESVLLAMSPAVGTNEDASCARYASLCRSTFTIDQNAK